MSPLDAHGASRALFIYYRVPSCCAQDLSEEVMAMQARLCKAFAGLQAHLMQRVEPIATPAALSAEAELTWMEVYSHPHGVSPACELALAKEAAALTAHGMGARHVEVFAPLMAP